MEKLFWRSKARYAIISVCINLVFKRVAYSLKNSAFLWSSQKSWTLTTRLSENQTVHRNLEY